MPVGQFQPNAWGMYDMHGNVWEWCLDGLRTYTKEETTDPKGPEGKNDARVLRGGFWIDYPYWGRSAFRGRRVPSGREGGYGCRVVLCLD